MQRQTPELELLPRLDVRTPQDSPRAPGVSEILIPGEPESWAKEVRLREGIPVPENTWERIGEAAAQLGVDLQKAMEQ